MCSEKKLCILIRHSYRILSDWLSWLVGGKVFLRRPAIQ